MTDKKFKKDDFENNVSEKNRLITKGIEVDIFFILETNIQNQ